MAFTPLAFTGISKFSEDFQTILKRSQDIATLPLKALQNDQRATLEQKAAWIPIETTLSQLVSAIERLGDIGSGQALALSSSDAATVSVEQSGEALAGTFFLGNISALARATTATTLTGLDTADQTPVNAAANELELVINGQATPLALTAATNNLNGVRDAINASNLGLQASVISTDAKHYLSLTASSGGETTIQLRTVPGSAASDLLQTTIQGQNAEFEINGRAVSKPSNVITDVIAGVTLSLKKTTSPEDGVSITVSRDRAQLTSALQDLVNSYNATIQALGGQIGEEAGALSGHSLVREIAQQLREVVSYSSDGTTRNLTELGVEFDRQGVMSLDASVISSFSDSQLRDAFQFLGSRTTGFGSAARELNQYSDPVLGLIQIQQSAYDTTNQRYSDQITTMTERIQAMQITLSAQLQAADALLARLDSQQSLLTATIESLTAVTYGTDRKS